MIEANGNFYKLALIDTCIISEFIKQRGEAFSRKLILRFCEDFIPSFSIQTFKELRLAPNIYHEFFSIFKSFPSLVLKDHEQICQEEFKNYGEQNQLNPGLTNLFNNPFAKEDLDIEKAIEVLYTPELQRKFENDKSSILDGVLSSRKNFQAKNKKYTKREIDEFVETTVITQLILRNREWVQNKLDKKENIEIDRFPSLKVMAYIIFYKFYLSDRKAHLSDVPDIIMSSLYPYIDVLLIEKSQAEMIRQIQRRHSFCPQLEVFTMKDLRD